MDAVQCVGSLLECDTQSPKPTSAPADAPTDQPASNQPSGLAMQEGDAISPQKIANKGNFSDIPMEHGRL